MAADAASRGGEYLVNGLECRLQNSQVISGQACRFRNFFLGHIPELFSTFFGACPGNAPKELQKKVPEWSPGMGPRKKSWNLQAWLGISWLSCDLHSRPLTKYLPPQEAATAADLAQGFKPGLRRLRQQPT